MAILQRLETNLLNHGVASGSAGLETWRLGATSFDSSKLALTTDGKSAVNNAVARSQPITDLYS